MDCYAIRETAMALHVDQREYLGFVLLRGLAGISEREIERDQHLASALPPAGAHWQQGVGGQCAIVDSNALAE